MSTNQTNQVFVKEEAPALGQVQFNTTNPNTVGTVFTPNTPQTQNIVYTSDVNGTTWIWNGTAYVGKVFPITNYLGKGCRITCSADTSMSAVGPIPYNTQNYINGDLVTFIAATRSLKLKAGYLYRVSASFYSNFSATTSLAELNFRTSTDGTTFTNATPNLIWSIPVTSGSNRSSQSYNWLYVKATVDTWVQYAALGNTTFPLPIQVVNTERQNHLSAFCIGALA